jgi:hypothetical protein
MFMTPHCGRVTPFFLVPVCHSSPVMKAALYDLANSIENAAAATTAAAAAALAVRGLWWDGSAVLRPLYTIPRETQGESGKMCPAYRPIV